MASSLSDRLKKLGVDCFSFNMNLSEKDQTGFTEDSMSWNEIDLNSLDKAIIYDYEYMDPIVPSAVQMTDWSQWQDSFLKEQQTYSFWFSLFCEMDRRGVKLYNPPRAYLDDFMKYHLLETIKSNGVSVPDIICSNSIDDVNEFCSKHPQTVWRPVSGKAGWQLFKDKQKNYLVATDKPPIMVAEIVEGSLLRGYMLAGKPLMCLDYMAPTQFPNESLEKYRCVNPDFLSHAVKTIQQSTHVEWGQLTVVANENNVFVYDIDTFPCYQSLPKELFEYFNTCLSYHLAGQQDKLDSVSLPEGYTERSTIFTRRMLDILYEFEQSKYSET